jgi:hypothetical protein
MQRLFSMFPRGAPGIALVILRLTVAAALPSAGPYALALAIPLALGLLTPAVALGCALIHGLRLLDGHATVVVPVLIALANSASLALLGPGAYSVDARLFGRRVFVVSGGSDGS